MGNLVSVIRSWITGAHSEEEDLLWEGQDNNTVQMLLFETGRSLLVPDSKHDLLGNQRICGLPVKPIKIGEVYVNLVECNWRIAKDLLFRVNIKCLDGIVLVIDLNDYARAGENGMLTRMHNVIHCAYLISYAEQFAKIPIFLRFVNSDIFDVNVLSIAVEHRFPEYTGEGTPSKARMFFQTLFEGIFHSSFPGEPRKIVSKFISQSDKDPFGDAQEFVRAISQNKISDIAVGE